MKRSIVIFCLSFISLQVFSQRQKTNSNKKTTTPKSVVDCLVNSIYSTSGMIYEFYSNGTGSVGKYNSFKWKYLGNKIVLVKYDSGYFSDDYFRIINLGKSNCDIIKID